MIAGRHDPCLPGICDDVDVADGPGPIDFQRGRPRPRLRSVRATPASPSRCSPRVHSAWQVPRFPQARPPHRNKPVATEPAQARWISFPGPSCVALSAHSSICACRACNTGVAPRAIRTRVLEPHMASSPTATGLRWSHVERVPRRIPAQELHQSYHLPQEWNCSPNTGLVRGKRRQDLCDEQERFRQVQTNPEQSPGPDRALQREGKGHRSRVPGARPHPSARGIETGARSNSRQVLDDPNLSAVEPKQRVCGNHGLRMVPAHTRFVQLSQVDCAVHHLRWLVPPDTIIGLLQTLSRFPGECRHSFTEASWQ